MIFSDNNQYRAIFTANKQLSTNIVIIVTDYHDKFSHIWQQFDMRVVSMKIRVETCDNHDIITLK